MARSDSGGGCSCLVLIGIFLFGGPAMSLLNDLARDDPPPRVTQTAAPRPSLSVINWQYLGSFCVDGWASGSIGKRGACSHHGGVMSRWRDPAGREVSCRDAPPMTEQALAAARSVGGTVLC